MVVLVHGGFWKPAYDRSVMRPLVAPLVHEGWAVANIEYRRIGWPALCADAAAAVDALVAVDAIDLDRVITIGHSAGGHLATWLASRHRLPPGSPGAAPAVTVAGVVAQAGVLDLEAAAEQRLGDGATQSFLGGEPNEVPDRYAAASPIELLPIGVPVELVHGRRDTHVPLDQSRRYEAVARGAGDPVSLTEVAGDHFAIIDTTTDDWAACVAAARRLLA